MDPMMSDDDPLFRLMERMCRFGEQLPSEEEVLHDENARHRAEMRKIDGEGTGPNHTNDNFVSNKGKKP